MSAQPAVRRVFVFAALVALFVIAGGVAHATLLNLTTPGASGPINGAIYSQTVLQPSGSGVLDSFERLQANGTEQGYNTSASNVMDNKPGVFTRDLALSSAQKVTVNGTNYLEFTLDINQANANPLLSLDEVQIFQTSTPGQSVTNFTGGQLDLANSTLVYRMDAGTDSTVLLNASLSSGTGGSDMMLLVPASDFNFASNQTDLVLYSHFGGTDVSNGGFEQWALLSGQNTVVPEPASLTLIGIGVVALAAVRRARLVHARI